MTLPVDPIPYATPVLAATAGRNRRGGLIGYGVLSIVIGAPPALVALLAATNVVGVLLRPSRSSGLTVDDLRLLAALVAGLAAVLGAATLFIWCGIGSIRCRRWVRPVVLGVAVPTAVTSFLWALGLIVLAIDLGSSGSPALLILIGLVLVFGVGVPGAYIGFYKSESVRETLDAYDPGPRWTDRSPLRVFVGCVTLLLAGVGTLLLTLVRATPFFGVYLNGAAAVVATSLAALAMIVAAWLMYLGRAVGWWMAMVVVVGGFASAIVTLARLGMVEFYFKGGVSDYELNEIRQHWSLSGGTPIVFVLVVMGISVRYLIGVRQYFAPGRRDESAMGA